MSEKERERERVRGRERERGRELNQYEEQMNGVKRGEVRQHRTDGEKERTLQLLAEVKFLPLTRWNNILLQLTLIKTA